MTMVETECLIVGGGPAGMMAGFLFARAGIPTLVIEKHGDFLRDFRGDTVHPSTLEIMYELGLSEHLLERPHQKIERLAGDFGGEFVHIADFSDLPTHYKFVALMPQWHFLDFLAGQGKTFPAFSLRMNTEATDLIEENGRVAGVVAKTPDGDLEIRAKLTIGADGRHSTLRERSGFAVADIGAPIDVLWFRVGRDPGNQEDVLLHAGPGHFIVTLDRGDYWQCAYVIPKNAADTVKAAGIDAFKARAARTVPYLGPHIDDVKSFDDVKLLTVAIDRLQQWSRPGLLFIGDSAHAMSPIGGVGINLAIQDAVAAANLLAGKMAGGSLRDEDLDLVRERRMFPARVTQFAQVQAQNFILSPIVKGEEKKPRPPLPLEIVSRIPWLQRRAAALVGLGVRPEHVHSPRAT